MPTKPEPLVEGLVFPEGPRWHDGRLWFSDMHAHAVMTTDLDGMTAMVVQVPAQPSGLGWLPDGRLLVVSMTDRRVLRLEDDGELVTHADLGAIATWHCNDMVVNTKGNAYVGNFGFDLYADTIQPVSATMAIVTPDGAVRPAAEDLMFPNGTVITPDGRTLIVGESMGMRLTAFDMAEDGSLSGRREFANLTPNLPDGICLDAEGAIWSADPCNGECIRVLEGGRVTDRILTGRGCFACMLGGDDRRTLFLCTAEDSGPERTKELRSGRIDVVEVDVPGAGLP